MIYNAESEPPYWYAVGITSFGPKTCGTAGNPGVYTKVSSFLRFIAENVND